MGNSAPGEEKIINDIYLCDFGVPRMEDQKRNRLIIYTSTGIIYSSM